MKKQLIFFSLLFLTPFLFAQSTGTLSGTLWYNLDTSNSDTVDEYFLTSPGAGHYQITGTVSLSPSDTNVSILTYYGDSSTTCGSENSDNGTPLEFNTNCLRANDQLRISVQTSVSSTSNTNNSYSINYVFVPATYGADSEPNDDYSQAINTVEGTNYEGNMENTNLSYYSNDWYKFTANSNGTLKIRVEMASIPSGEYPSIILNLYDDSGNGVTESSTNDDNYPNETIYIFEDFNHTGENFGIELLGGGCVSYRLSWTIEDSSLSVSDFDLNKSIELYPIPVSDNLNIQNNGNLNIEKIEFVEMTGKIVSQPVILDNVVSTENLSGGIYFVKIYTDKGLITKKIIKME